MALFNKLFNGLRNTPRSSQDESNVRQKVPEFTAKEIRLVLFRECDFRGRKLLFDSDVTEKIPMEKAPAEQKFVEVSNNYGYVVNSKQISDYQHLSEMIFGSVAMSFRGTYLKIHSLNDPRRLMFTQVFPTPEGRQKKSSTSSNQSHLSTQSSFDHSIKLDDSGANSAFSTSDQLSDRSTASDTILVCRRLSSNPLDVPGVMPSFSRNSLVVDSGCASGSFASISTGPPNFPTWESVFSNKDLSTLSFSSSGVFKRILRSSTCSLQTSSISLPNSTEVLHKSHNKGSKLGFTIIVEISPEKERLLTQFFMEHIALLEALIWRTHRSIAIAYHCRTSFISLMMDIACNTATWLVNLLNAPSIVTNLWHCLSFGCDDYSKISPFKLALSDESVDLLRTSRQTSASVNSESVLRGLQFSESVSGVRVPSRNDVPSFNFNTCSKTDLAVNNHCNLDADELSEKFLKEFCELVEGVDVKETNFFVSTLLTAVLTHHLGWVATVLPQSNLDAEQIRVFQQPYNALWSQLSDLYGAIGHPLKTSQTVITGSNKNNIISKLLNSLTYFIRFGNIERKNVCRSSVETENQVAGLICIKHDCIPKENYKKYEDHLKELLILEPPISSCSNIQPSFDVFSKHDQERKISLMPPKGLNKVKSMQGLDDLQHHSTRATKSIGLSRVPSTLQQCLAKPMDVSSEYIAKLPKSSDGTQSSKAKTKPISKCSNFNDLLKLEEKTELEMPSTGNSIEGYDDPNSVIFVLGDNEELVGLRMDERFSAGSSNQAKVPEQVASGAKRKISVGLSKLVSIPTNKPTEPLTDPNCQSCLLQSSSYEALYLENEVHSKAPLLLHARAQSEPPEVRKSTPAKYQYSRVKFNLQQYPQVVRNYMKSKNIELEGLSLGEKVFDKFATVQNNIKLDLSGYESDAEEVEALQTPSNASELEFSPDMGSRDEQELTTEPTISSNLMKLVNIPMPKSLINSIPDCSIPYRTTVIKGLVDTYIPDMVLQGTTDPKHKWHSELRNNLAMNSQHSLLDQPVDEALAIVADTDTWEVQVISSHTYVIDKEVNGVRAVMSQLVANMLESLLQMWKLQIPPKHCIQHIEQSLQQLCLRSKALAQMLIASEFCNIELLASTLQIEVNDVPLMMAVASTYSPEVTHKYGLSFQ
ncbi:folliculin-interacting protein 2 isoform X1 [Dendroctonus ponderosae]|uniref:folliculin-interacting protein 2 isoform X1 n=1 Tax=Dendroctonus ponderosae TaxID=77166 RepID=UPI002035F1A1|nr:folliculin-interacting protein 2 isoform X1 [Dendroctonus ponderosae]KAH1023887.1 hypothetical protein HUJ05_003476 [Dendroctonus ponderosae]KAH1023888.1 hypothetical protein HUJ05_003476 [Dendroctonus ponderosae]